jgi:sporulation protein YlmC with PRC-barrel domain
MLLTNNRLSHAPILSLQTGTPLGETTTPIIDPRQLYIPGFFCQGQRMEGATVLHSTDIREVTGMGLIVDGSHVLMQPDDLVRLQEVISFHFELIGKRVVDTRHRKLGRVSGYSIDSGSFFITKIHVQQPLFKNFLTGGVLMIDRTQIVEVNDKRITVHANEAKQKATAKILENPFRNQPQPRSSANADAPRNQ